MAGRGPAPKEPGTRARARAEHPLTDLDGAVSVAAPELPGAADFREETRVWYETWCSSPQASQFMATDWQRLHMLAAVVDAFWCCEDDARLRLALIAEIRLQEAKLGATPEDRLRLRWRLRESEREDDRAAKAPAARSRRRSDPRLSLVEGGSSS